MATSMSVTKRPEAAADWRAYVRDFAMGDIVKIDGGDEPPIYAVVAMPQGIKVAINLATGGWWEGTTPAVKAPSDIVIELRP